MRKWLVAAGVGLLLVAAAALLAAVVLRSRAEDGWRAALDQLEQALGGGTAVTYSALEVPLFARSGTLRNLSITATGLRQPFVLTVERIDAGGVGPADGQGLRVARGSASGVVLVAPRGRWQLDRLTFEGAAVDGRVAAEPKAALRRLSVGSARIERLAFERRPAPPRPDDALATPALRSGARLSGTLARAELGGFAAGRLERLRFERLALEVEESVDVEIVLGGLDGLDALLLVSGSAGRLMPERPLFRSLRVEKARVRERDSEIRFASLVAEQRPESAALGSEVAVEGLRSTRGDPTFGRFWAPIEAAGYGTGFRLHGVAVTDSPANRLHLRSLRLELPEAASLELEAELLDLDDAALAAEPASFGDVALRARLASAELTLVDSGGLDAILAGAAAQQRMTARQLRQVAAFQVAEVLRQGLVPRELGLAVQEFLADPGRLEIRIAPPEPVPLLSLALFGLAPERAAERFRMSARSLPAR